MAEDRKCPVCGTATKNPKYCSRSCSAQASNRTSPKRRPEGNCERCGERISTRLRLCENCQEQVEIPEIASSLTPIVHIHQVTEFKLSCHDSVYRPPFDEARPAGDLLGFLMGAVQMCPPYISAEDIPMLGGLLSQLSQFETKVWDKGSEVKDSVARMPIRKLGVALNNWVQSLMRDDKQHLLMPAFAIGLCQFLEPHMFETDFYRLGGERWQIVPVVNWTQETFAHHQLGVIHDTQAKREITQYYSRCRVVVTVPQGCIVQREIDDSVIFREGDRFCLTIKRGHLTDSSPCDRDDAFAVQPEQQRFNILERFRIRGGFQMSPKFLESPTFDPDLATGPYLELEVPIRWISDAVTRNASSRRYELSSIPSWAATKK